MARLIAFAGLPGAGKSTVARALALRTGAIWLRADSIEQALMGSRAAPADIEDMGYRAGYAVAEDNLRLGRDVIADCLNDWAVTREAWQAVGGRACAQVIWVEIVCSDSTEHRRRVETRMSDVAGLELPSWAAVLDLDYHPWDRERLMVDTATQDVETCVDVILGRLDGRLAARF
jgi:predicted kinase